MRYREKLGADGKEIGGYLFGWLLITTLSLNNPELLVWNVTTVWSRQRVVSGKNLMSFFMS